MGFAGYTGLDYPAVLALMALHEIPQAERAALMDDIRVLEGAALKQMAVKYT